MKLQLHHGDEVFSIKSDVTHQTNFNSGYHNVAAFIETSDIGESCIDDSSVGSKKAAATDLDSEIQNGCDANEDKNPNGKFDSFLVLVITSLMRSDVK